jgi:hypothetical protein
VVASSRACKPALACGDDEILIETAAFEQIGGDPDFVAPESLSSAEDALAQS